MTPSSFELPQKPLRVEHLACGATWEMYAIEWPPKIVVCTECQVPLKLVGLDPETQRLAYRTI